MSQIADEPVRAALDKLEDLSADEQTRRLAFVRERALLDEASLLRDAREEGLVQGREEGKAQALRQTALNLIHATAMDDQAIAAITGLPVAAIRELRSGAQE